MDTIEFRFAFHARDFERSVRFYEDVLGLTLLPGGWDRPDGKGALLTAGGNAVIEIYGAPDGLPPHDFPPLAESGINLGFQVDDVDGYYERLVAAGVRVAEPPQTRAWGHYSFWFHDPDGVHIAIYSVE